jgi:uncharacterized protein
VALSVEGREKVDQMINNAIKAGGRESREPQDHGWMYGRSFEDIDGHLWEIIYMDESAMKKVENLHDKYLMKSYIIIWKINDILNNRF